MKISVIIPTANRPQDLKRCLASLAAQTLLPDEIIVVNDGQTPLSFEFLKVEPHGQSPWHLTFRRAKPAEAKGSMHSSTGRSRGLLRRRVKIRELKTKGGEGQSVAKNLGSREARGDIIVFTDDDCVADQDWLALLMRPFSNPRVAVVVGQIAEKKLKTKKDTFSDIFLNLPFFPLYLLRRKRQGGTIYCNSRVDANLTTASQGFCHWGGAGNFAIRKAFFQKGNGFDEALLPGSANEEPDLCWRVREKGGLIFYNGQARVEHYHSKKRRLNHQQEMINLRGNEVYFGLKNLAFRSFGHFVIFLIYQGWQVFIYAPLALLRWEYWWRIQGKIKGLRHWQSLNKS